MEAICAMDFNFIFPCSLHNNSGILLRIINKYNNVLQKQKGQCFPQLRTSEPAPGQGGEIPVLSEINFNFFAG